jgi:hypothetical protein
LAAILQVHVGTRYGLSHPVEDRTPRPRNPDCRINTLSPTCRGDLDKKCDRHQNTKQVLYPQKTAEPNAPLF